MRILLNEQKTRVCLACTINSAKTAFWRIFCQMLLVQGYPMVHSI